MRAAILKAPRKFVIEELPIPEIKEDEVLIKTKICGVCTSELDIWNGVNKGIKFPIFIGHEVSGIIEKTGPKVTAVKPGDAVSVWCDGKGYAEYVAIKEAYVYKLKNKNLLSQALGEPIACSVNGVRKLNVQLNESVCIVGCGFMGLIMLQVFKVAGVGMIIAVDTRDSILQIAKKLGAHYTFNPLKHNVKNEIYQLTNQRGVDIGVEAAGNQKSLDLTSEIVRMEGKLEVFGFHQGEARQVNWGYWNWMAFQIINGHTRSPHIYVEGMRIGLQLLEMNKLKMKDLVTHHFPLTQINEAFKIAIKKPQDFVKGMITF